MKNLIRYKLLVEMGIGDTKWVGCVAERKCHKSQPDKTGCRLDYINAT
jgi:hypothetical protein